MGKLQLSADSFRWGTFVRDQEAAREQQSAAYGYNVGSHAKFPIEVKILGKKKKTLVIGWQWEDSSHLYSGGPLVTRHQKVELPLASVTGVVAGLKDGSGTPVSVGFAPGSCNCSEGRQPFDSDKRQKGKCTWQPAYEAFAADDNTTGRLSFVLTNTEAKICKDLADLLSIGAPAAVAAAAASGSAAPQGAATLLPFAAMASPAASPIVSPAAALGIASSTLPSKLGALEMASSTPSLGQKRAAADFEAAVSDPNSCVPCKKPRTVGPADAAPCGCVGPCGLPPGCCTSCWHSEAAKAWDWPGCNCHKKLPATAPYCRVPSCGKPVEQTDCEDCKLVCVECRPNACEHGGLGCGEGRGCSKCMQQPDCCAGNGIMSCRDCAQQWSVSECCGWSSCEDCEVKAFRGNCPCS